jgi:hypothetical protein
MTCIVQHITSLCTPHVNTYAHLKARLQTDQKAAIWELDAQQSPGNLQGLLQLAATMHIVLVKPSVVSPHIQATCSNN